MQESAGRIGRRPSRNTKVKGLVCMHMWWPDMDRDRKDSSRLPQLPEAPSISTTCTNAIMELAQASLVKDPNGVCKSQVQSHVLGDNWRPLQMDWGIPNERCDCLQQKLQTSIRTVWTTINRSVRQWPCFKSKEFKAFFRKNGIQHVTTDPYHPSSKGLAEWEGLQKMKQGTISDSLARFLCI